MAKQPSTPPSTGLNTGLRSFADDIEVVNSYAIERKNVYLDGLSINHLFVIFYFDFVVGYNFSSYVSF
jgi:hypothetical protein